MAWIVEGLDSGFVTGSPGFVQSSGKVSQTFSHSFSISTVMCFFFSLEKRSGECGWGA